MTGSVRFRTHGKVNLFLRVLGLRSDGYHEVETILHGVSLGDDIVITPTSSGIVEVEMRFAEGTMGAAPDAADNLVARAAEALARRRIAHPGLRIEIVKRVPVGAGMGGGSANAAGAFLVLNEMLAGGLGRDELLRLAGELGSDVPYCLEGGTALATGRGEQVTTLVAPAMLWFVLGISFEPLLTARVYAVWDEMGKAAKRGSAPMTLALGAGDADRIAAHLHNDLELAAFSLRPELAAKKQALLKSGCAGALLSGSGPTLFGLCRNEEQAHLAAEKSSAVFDRVEVVQSQPQCLVRL